MDKKGKVCPVEIAGFLDGRLRKLVHDPEKILGPFISGSEAVLDFGCGPGFFTAGIARMLKSGGKVTASDIQKGMLERVEKKIMEERISDRVILHRHNGCDFNFNEKFDLIVAFYVIHEVPDRDILFRSFYELLKPGGRLFICEPKMHVSGKSFERMTDLLKSTGFKVTERPKVFFSRTVVAEREG